MITWTIAIDWDRNGNFTDPYDNVTGRVIDARWFLGMQKPYQDVAVLFKVVSVLGTKDFKLGNFTTTNTTMRGKVPPIPPYRAARGKGQAKS
jgi:hypothetical protein